MYLLIFLGCMILSFIASTTLNAKVKKYSGVSNSSGLSGKEIAEKMLRDNGIYDVKVTCTGGFLTDHYNPGDKTVNLSRGVYEGRHITAAAVAAHECGHAVQHATSYRWLAMRSMLVPAVQFGANWSQWLLLAGLLLYSLAGIGMWVCLLGVILFALTTLFSFVTLPVEYDASSRAVAWLENAGITTGRETAYAKDALACAARTYVVAALSSLATLLYYIMLICGNRD